MDDDATKVLVKGLNFAIAPRKIPTVEIIGTLETTCRRLPTQIADEIRLDAPRILPTTKPPMPSLTRKEFQFINELMKNENIIILPAETETLLW